MNEWCANKARKPFERQPYPFPFIPSFLPPLSGVFLCLGVGLGVGFGCSFFVLKKTKRDKMAGLGVGLDVVFWLVLCGLLGGVMPVEYAIFSVFLVFVGGGITVLLSWSLSVTRCKSMK